MGLVRKIYNFSSSMKTGLALLLMVGVFSALGSTLLPHKFYKTTAFEILLLLLLFNMIFCTLKRLNRTCSLLVRKPSNIRWFRQIGILMLHFGIVLILIGGIIFTTFGQENDICLQAGDKAEISSLLERTHPFTLQLEDFKIEFNEDGSTSQYVSEVTILEQEKAISEAKISVNHPLEYEGVKTYQNSFGYLIKARYIDNTGKYTLNQFNEGDILRLNGTDKVLKIYKYIPNFDPLNGMNSINLRPDNPHIIFSVYEDNKLLEVGASRLGEQIKIDNNTIVEFTGVDLFTILHVKSDPGLPLVLVGGIILMLGVCLALFFTPIRKKQVTAVM